MFLSEKQQPFPILLVCVLKRKNRLSELKNLTAIILTLSLLTFQVSELLVFVSFKLNQDYIAKNLCVEKDVEGSACKGCCQLKKRMEEQQESKKTLPPVQSEKQTIDFWNQSTYNWINYYPEHEMLIVSVEREYFLLMPQQIFHPPQM